MTFASITAFFVLLILFGSVITMCLTTLMAKKYVNPWSRERISVKHYEPNELANRLLARNDNPYLFDNWH